MRIPALAVPLLCALLGACAAGSGGPPPEAEARVVDGYLIYREPLILPPDALAEVRLVRLGGDGAVSDIVAVSNVQGPLVPPIPFRLLYDPHYLASGAGPTALTAGIELYGRTLFSSDGALPVVLPLPAEDDILLVPLFGQWGAVEIGGAR